MPRSIASLPSASGGAKSVRDGNVIGEHAEHEVGDDRRGGDSDLHREDRVTALGVRDHGNGEDRGQPLRRAAEPYDFQAFR
jgi:hypothetical protein